MKFFIRRMAPPGGESLTYVPETTSHMVSFIYLTGGEAYVEMDSESFLCQTGHLLIIPREIEYSVKYYSDTRGYMGSFPESVVRDEKLLSKLSSPLQQSFWFDDGAFVDSLMNMFVLSMEKDNLDFIERGLDLLLSMIKPHGLGRTVPPMVTAFLDAVFMQNAAPLTPDEYAAKAFVSTNHLNRTVKKHTGKSLGEWIALSRVGIAKKLLSSTDMPIADVGLACGLEDPSYFSRFFRRQCGLTPQEFRSRMHG